MPACALQVSPVSPVYFHVYSGTLRRVYSVPPYFLIRGTWSTPGNPRKTSVGKRFRAFFCRGTLGLAISTRVGAGKGTPAPPHLSRAASKPAVSSMCGVNPDRSHANTVCHCAKGRWLSPSGAPRDGERAAVGAAARGRWKPGQDRAPVPGSLSPVPQPEPPKRRVSAPDRGHTVRGPDVGRGAVSPWLVVVRRGALPMLVMGMGAPADVRG